MIRAVKQDTMSKIQSVKPLLSAAADEIMKDVEKIIAGYEEEMFQSKREISRQRKMLDAPKPEIKLNTITERLPIEADEDAKMSKIEGLRVLVKHFLSVAADRIMEAVEKMIADYEGEMHQSKRDISQQCKMLRVLLQPEITLTRIPGTKEAQLNLSVWEKDFLTEQQQEWNSSARQKNPESLQTERSHKDKAEEELLLVPSPGFSELENGDDDDWNATQEDSDSSEEWSNSGQHRTLTAKKPRSKKRLNSCKVCRKSFATTSNLEIHMRSHTEEEYLSVQSPGFPEPENGDDDDWNATRDGHIDRSEERSNSGQHRRLTAKKPRMEKTKSCKVCGKSFHYEGSLVKHLKRHPKDECGLCGMHFKTEEDFNLHVETHKTVKKTVKVVVCDVCGKSFFPGYLKEHMRIHTGERPFICEVCGKGFIGHADMKKHLKTHTEEMPFRCELCGKSFRTQKSLTRHHMIHTGVKPYSCTTCSEHFIRYSMLRKHMRTHSKHKNITVTTAVFDARNVNAEMEDSTPLMPKEQQIICKVCGKDFHSKFSLVKHLESHPKDDCGLCGMHFHTEEDFELHLKTHIATVCDVCGKCFAKNPFYLERHMMTHMGEKPFKCTECGKSFRQRSNLTDHLRIHTGEKPYSCATCGKRFKTNSNLKQHMRVVKHFVSAMP